LTLALEGNRYGMPGMYDAGDIEVAVEDGLSIVRLLGEHDLASQRLLATKLATLIESGNPLVFDVTRATFMDSTVVHAVLRARSALAARSVPVALVVSDSAPAGIRKLIELASADTSLVIAQSTEQAKQQLLLAGQEN
jgi:anti-sigma B factor antagonist